MQLSTLACRKVYLPAFSDMLSSSQYVQRVASSPQGRRGSPSMHASLILASVCERRIGGEGLFLFLFLTLALLAVTPRYSHPHPLPRSEARESNKATWVVVAYLVLMLFSPSFHLSSSLFLLLSLFLSMNIDFSTRMYPPRDGRFSLAPRSIRFPSQSRLISPRCRIRTRSLASVTPTH